MEKGLLVPPRDTGPRPNPEMTQDFTLWKHQIRRAIEGLYAPALCSGARSPAMESDDATFHQAMHALYGESHFQEFLSCQAWRQAGLNEATGHALQALQQQLDAYDEPDSDAAIAGDPVWWAIQIQAQTAVALLG